MRPTRMCGNDERRVGRLVLAARAATACMNAPSFVGGDAALERDALDLVVLAAA